MVSMIDLESGSGNPTTDVSSQVNSDYGALGAWLGNTKRVIGYGNTSDLNNLWLTKPAGLQLIIAAYGSNPSYPGKFAHQYTNGQGYGAGLPEGAPPFGNCDMNSADGLSPIQLATALGLPGVPVVKPPVSGKPTDQPTQVSNIWDQVLGPTGKGWAQINNHTVVDALAEIGQKLGLTGYTPPTQGN
jgi:hypothetical protein